LKSYNNRFDLLYRKELSRRKKDKNRLKGFTIRIFKILILTGILLSIIFLTINYIKRSSFFYVKKVVIKISNEKTNIDESIFETVKNVNIFKVKDQTLKDIVHTKIPEYEIKSIKRILPKTLIVICYRKIPLLFHNENTVIYNDKTISDRMDYIPANYIVLETDLEHIGSIYDVSGLPTIFTNIIKEKENIKKIKIEEEYIKIYLKNNKIFLIDKGEKLPDFSKYIDFKFKIFDFRFKNGIYVKR